MTEVGIELKQKQKLSQSVQTAIQALSFDTDELIDFMVQSAQENLSLELVPPARPPEELIQLVRSRFQSRRASASASPAAPEAAYQATPMEALEQQLRLMDLPPDVRHAALLILHQLDSRGYFSQDLAEFSAEADVPYPTALRALTALQALEPAGVGARNLAECLALQLRQNPETDPLCYELVKNYLPQISRRSFRSIAKETGMPQERVEACVEAIRALTPVPCSLEESFVRYIVPVFTVEKDAHGQLIAVFHNDFYPTLRRDETFARMADSLTGTDREYVRGMLLSGARVLRALEMRQMMLDKVAALILREQRGFFLEKRPLRPLRIDDAAREMGVHETTVYRAIQGKYLYCAWGTFPLGHFFQRELSQGVSSDRAKELIRQLCQEDPGLSDRAICEALHGQGVSLSRRTVAKYRSQMAIDTSFRRIKP